MADGTLNQSDQTDLSDFEQRAERIRNGVFSPNGKDDDIRRAVGSYLENIPDDAPASIRSYLIDALGSDPDTVASITNYLSGAGTRTVQFDDTTVIGTSTKAGEPVDLATGQVVQHVTDFIVSGAGIDFDFVRTYRSGGFYQGPMGSNWDHAYNLWLRTNIDNSISVTSGQFREIRYLSHQFFPYYVAIGDDNIVAATLDGAFEQRSPDGRVVRFEQVGDADGTIYRAVHVADRFGNTLQFSYDAQNRLGTVTVNHPARLVAFSYDDLSRIQNITLFPVTYATETGPALIQRTWTYAYDDFSDLVAVSGPSTDEFPAGRTTQYGYSSPSSFAQRQHDLLTITDPNGNTFLENEFGNAPGTVAYGKVVRQRVGSGVFLFDYSDVIPDPAWTFNDADRPISCVTVVQRDGHPVRYILNGMGNILASQETVLAAGEQDIVWRYGYDADGRRTATLSPAGRVTQIYYGSDDFYRRQINPGDSSLPMWQDPNLSAAEHARFANVVSTVRRSEVLTLSGQLDDLSIYGAIFPDPLVVVAEDIIVKRSYETRFQQLATTSDPRHTASPDPAAPESLDPNSSYSKHLTVTSFNGDAGATTAAINYPNTTYPAPLANGSPGVVAAQQTFDAYDANGRLLQWTEPEGNVFAYTYFVPNAAQPTTEGFLSSSTAGVGVLDLRTTLAVNEAGQVVAVTDPLQSTTQYALDAFSLVRTVTPPIAGYAIEYTYDGNAQVNSRSTAIIDPDGSVAPGSPEVATFQYNEEMSVELAALGDSSATPPRRTQHVYDTSNRLIRLMKPRGNSACVEYDERSLLKRITCGCCAAEAATTAFGYDHDEIGVSVTDPCGHVASTKLDAFCRAIGTTDALGNLQRTDYDKLNNAVVQRTFGCLASGAYPLLRRVESSYDERGRLVRTRTAFFTLPIPTADPWAAPDAEFNAAVWNGAVQAHDTLIFRDGNLRIFRAVDANGNATTFEYDAANRQVATTDSAGNVVRLTYDAASNVTRQDRYLVDAGGVTRAVISTAYEFDALNRLKTTIDGAGNRIAYGLDSRGLLRTVTDALGHLTKYGHNGFGDQVTVTEVLLPPVVGGVTTDLTTVSSFDANGNVTAIADPAGNTTAFEYDVLDRRTRVINPDGTSRTTAYDRCSNPTDAVDEERVRVSRTYDALDRLVGIAVQPPSPGPASAELTAQFSYDGAGALIGHANDFVNVAMTCDSLGRCYGEALTFGPPLGAVAPPLTLTRQFDAVSNRIGLVYPSGQTLRYDFGPDNLFLRLTSTANAAAYPGDPGAPPNRSILQKQRASDLTISRQLGNGVTSVSAYDAASRPIDDDCSLPNGQEFLWQQLWDGAGNRALSIEPGAGILQGSWHDYDSTNRLIASLPLPAPQAVTTGPLAPPLAPVPVAAFQCQRNIDNVVAGYGMNSPAQPQTGYDAAGNRVNQSTPAGNVVYTANGRNEYLNVGPAALAYDRAGRLVADANGVYAYNFGGQLIQAAGSGGNVLLQIYHDALGRPVGIVAGPHTRVIVRDGVNAVESYDDGALSELYLWEVGDRLSFIAAAGKDQYVLRDVLNSTRLTTDSQGAVIGIFSYDPFGNLLSGAPSIPFLYSGKYLYDSIGWYEFNARQYLPPLGRFAQPDPAGFLDGANLYTFVGNDPLSATDPSGTNVQQVPRAAVTEPSGPPSEGDRAADTNPELEKRRPVFPFGEFGTAAERMLAYQKNRFYEELDASRSVVESTTLMDSLLHKLKAADAFVGVFLATAAYVGERPGLYVGWSAAKIDELQPGALDALATYPEPLMPAFQGLRMGVGNLAFEMKEARMLLRPGGAQVERFMARGYSRVAAEYVLPTPQVESRKLQNLIDNLYKHTTTPTRFGYGTTAEALTREFATGRPVGRSFHLTKGIETYSGLAKWLKLNPTAPWRTKLIVQTLLEELEGGGP
jgi:RHS repeat-associated protein